MGHLCEALKAVEAGEVGAESKGGRAQPLMLLILTRYLLNVKGPRGREVKQGFQNPLERPVLKRTGA